MTTGKWHLVEAIADSEDGWERNSLFQQMRARLLTHSHAEDEVLYRRLKSSQHEASRKFAQEGEREHQLVEQQLQKMLAADDKISDVWMEQLTECRSWSITTSTKKKALGSAARATSSTRTS